MLGMPAPDAAAVAEAVAQARAAKAAKAAEGSEAAAPIGGADAGKTQLGVGANAPGGAVKTLLDAGTADQAFAKTQVPQEPDLEVTNRGLGAAARAASSAQAEPATGSTASSPADARSPRGSADSERPRAQPTNRTMLGQPAPKVEVDAPPSAEPARHSSIPPGPRGRAAVVFPADTGEEEALTLPKRRGSGGAIALLVVGALILVLGGGALAYSLMTSGSGLGASVVQGDDGEMLQIEVPGAAAGTKVRFHGSEKTLEAGRARFALSADDLSLGDNGLSVDVVAPDGSVDTESIQLHLDLRVRADLGPLASAPPAIDVVVEAPPGSQVTLDGEPLELDAQGRGTRRYPISGSDANAEGVVDHVVRYRVVPPEGESAQGDLHTRIPLTSMQLDRPGREVVTDASSVEVAGAVSDGTTVTVDGENVEVRMGRFLTTYALPEPGDHTIEIVARAPGKAPRVESIHVRRVADLEEEADRFEVNHELTYGRISQNPTTYRGQHVELSGLVYNVIVRDGHSDIQIDVDGCPSPHCPIWVSYPAATTIEAQHRVRVLGTVAGEQQFRSESGDIRTVPKIEATFVLPARSGRHR